MYMCVLRCFMSTFSSCSVHRLIYVVVCSAQSIPLTKNFDFWISKEQLLAIFVCVVLKIHLIQ